MCNKNDKKKFENKFFDKFTSSLNIYMYDSCM